MNILIFTCALLAGIVLGNTNTDCCKTKKVGPYTYNLADTKLPKHTDCYSSCVYTRQGDPPGHYYCFAYGNLSVECLSKGEECPGANGEFIARTVGQCPITSWDCVGDNIDEIPNVLDWDDCGYHCQANAECNWWTYSVADKICWLKTSCRWGVYNNNTISGNKDCPLLFNEQSYSLCFRCGSCPCCYGGCVWGRCLGWCADSAVPGLSQDEGCLWEANAIGNKECEEDCKADDDACIRCISGNVPEVCQETKSAGIFPCIGQILGAIKKCLKNPGPSPPLPFVECVIDGVISQCKKEACKYICKLFPVTGCTAICDAL